MNKITKIAATAAILAGTFTTIRSCNNEYQMRQPRPVEPTLENIMPAAVSYYQNNRSPLTGSFVPHTYVPVDIDGNGIDALVTTGASRDSPLRVVHVIPEKKELMEKAGYDCRNTYTLTPEVAAEATQLEEQMRQFGLKIAQQQYIENAARWDLQHKIFF
jgi:hypothetical protein